jgi:hypothetical protein
MMVVNDVVAGSEAFIGRKGLVATKQDSFAQHKVAEHILEHCSRCKKPIDVVYRSKKKHMTCYSMSK